MFRVESGSSARLRVQLIVIWIVCSVTYKGKCRAGIYDEFASFADTAFAALRDPLAQQLFGTVLQNPYDWWVYASDASASIAFDTNLPALSRLEYGTSPNYGSTTTMTDRRHALHLHHLTGLQPSTPYHYRAVLEGEDGSIHYGPDRQFITSSGSGAIHLPGTLSGPPFVLDEAGAVYILTQDLLVPHAAFQFAASDVTLDLGGHRVVYDEQPIALSGSPTEFRDQSSMGVRSVGFDGVKVFNGALVQGAALSSAHDQASVGFNPIYVESASAVEIAGISIDYSGNQMVGVFVKYIYGSSSIHHNRFTDRGSGVTNRHGVGSRSIALNGAVNMFETHHNLVSRTRQSALDGDRIHHNEIYIDSHATNSFGIHSLENDREAFGNRIFGTGYHVVGIGWGRNNHWHDNYLRMVGQGPGPRFPELGIQESLNGFRLTQYFGATEDYSDSIVENNFVSISGGSCNADGACTQARGLQYFSDPHVVNNLIRNNTIRVVMDPSVTQAAAIVTQGFMDLCGSEAPLFYIGNTIISNVANVRIGDYYGAGCNHVFYDNQFVRVGSRSDYRTILFDEPVPTVNHGFFGSTYVGGANPTAVTFSDPGQSFAIGWSLSLAVTDDGQPVAGATIRLFDAEGNLLEQGDTDQTGSFATRAVEYIETSAGRSYRTPVEVRIDTAEHAIIRWIELNENTELQIDLGRATGADDDSGAPALLLVARPSPMARTTEISWGTALDEPGVLEIFDSRGRMVFSRELPSGADRFSWPGIENGGNRVGSGVYFLRMSTAGREVTTRLTRIR